MEQFVIKGEIRKDLGKNACRRLRKEGKLPGILYGNNMENIPIIVDKKDIQRILKSETGENTIFKITLDSQTYDVIIKDLQRDPVFYEPLHVDLYHIAMDKPIEVTVAIALKGDAVGVKSEGGFLDFVTREIDIRCLPKDIPEYIEVDISDLHVNQALKVEDIKVPEGIEILEDPEVVIVHVLPPEEEEKVEEEEEKEETLFAEEPEQPEVIGKEKPSEEEEEEEKEEE
ncbi:50S ribosomal protein L25/general stress protein Ctc [SCandidatus Aminicenantes bacterium Aminicenantia_JdfR_composite]|jgi:large subunit ribosomal protein L25|nr:50S ribosomal protein L25/general stress protein Ctc [SCandidatus Aminicenantes bacterium Aminicenantia_JdfR_composite]MCP2597701.1 50S ribosomal protein L25/general stress protein Ctc [Candidatus Aminicenantes bacterium AC-335-G13]